jgi:hypothetical protein
MKLWLRCVLEECLRKSAQDPLPGRKTLFPRLTKSFEPRANALQG